MQKKQNIYLGVLFIILLLVLGGFFFLNKDAKAPTVDPNIEIIDNSTETEEIPIDKEKIISETMGSDPQLADIFALQDILGPEIVMEIDCNSIVNEQAKTYCISEKAFAIEFFARTTWGDVTREGYEYAMNFDCADIFLEAGQKTCEEFQITSK